MNTKAGLLISGSGTVLTLFLFDILKIVPSPLAGVNHWIPEVVFVFLMGRYVAQNLSKPLILTITGCLILYNVLTYFLLYNVSGVQFGLGAGSLFSGAFLMGVPTAHR